MGSGSDEPTRRHRSKHRLSSVDDDVPSKRRKHRHHRHRRCDDVAEHDEGKRHVADYDLEEGEIVEEEQLPILGIHSARAEVGGDSCSLPLEDKGSDSEDKLVKNGKVLVAEDLTGGRQTCNEGVLQQDTSYGNGDIRLNENYCVPRENESPVQSRSRSHSRGRGRERSKSFEKVSPMRMTHKKDDDRRLKDGKRTNNDANDERMAVPNWDFSRHGFREVPRDNDRGHSSSYSSRYRQEDSYQGREFRNSEQERSRESREKETITTSSRDSDRQTHLKKYRERERERDKESDREISRLRDRDKERERTQEREERDRRKDRELERGMESGRHRRSRDRESYRDMENGRNRSRDRESYGERESGRHRSRDRESYRDRERERNRDGDENRVKKDNVNISRRDEEEQEDYQERVALQLVDQEEDDLDRIKEESRRRRQAIIEKYKMQQQLDKPQRGDEDKDDLRQVPQEVVAISVAPETLIEKNEDDAGTVAGDPSFIVQKSPPQNGVSISGKASGVGGLGEGSPKSETSGDMFCDDIFGDSPTGVRKTGKGDGLALERGGLHDNWDDAEGYYSFRLGEILDGRYEVAAAHGKGVFSTVVRAKDLKAGLGDPEEVAIKIIRNNEHMHKAGKEELVILKKLVGADPEDKRHCVRFLSSFKYRNHLCLVFESLNMNLREVLKKFGRNIGLKLTAVRLYSKQLFIALKHLRNCGVLHSDIKPDNMLVNEAKNVLKLCDFGNAMFAGKNEITPYLVSRFYRAPEIILGLAYDHPLDIWSVGCCIFELYCGKVLFPGATNNDMLRLHMELKGLFPKKMLRKGAFTEQHFDQDLNFLAIEEDPVTKKTVRRLITSIKPKDIGSIVTGSPGEDSKMLANFKDLLEKMFILDPDKRLTVSQALSHPFITGK